MSAIFFYIFGKGGSNRNQQTRHGQNPQQSQHGWPRQHGQHGPPGAHGGAPPLTPHPIGVGFYLNNGIRLEVRAGDITALEGVAVVAGENNNFTGGGAIAKALLRKGGEKYFEARRKMINEYLDRYPCPDVVLYCPAGDHLAFLFVFHALLTFHTDRGVVTMNSFEQLVDLYGHVLDLARKLKITSIVTPLLGSGASGGRLEDCVKAAFVAISNLRDNLIETITIVEYDQVKAQVIGMQLKDHIEHLAWSRHQKPAPPRPSYTPASSGHRRPDQRTQDPHRDRDSRERGSPKNHPAPPPPSPGAAQRVSSGPPPSASNDRPLGPEDGSPPVPPPRVKGKSDAKSPRGTATDPGGNPGYMESATPDRRDREEEARRRSGDTSGQRATFDRSTKPERGREIPVQRAEDLLNAPENARPVGHKKSQKENGGGTALQMDKFNGGLNDLNLEDKPGVAHRGEESQQHNFGAMERQGGGFKQDSMDRNRGIEISIRREGMEEQNAARMPQPNQFGTRASGDHLPPQGKVDHNSANAYLANMHGTNGGYNSNLTPFPQPGSPGMITEGRGDNSRYPPQITYPHPGGEHDAPLSPLVYPPSDHSPTSGMQGTEQLPGSQRYLATATTTLSTSTGAGPGQNPVFPRDMHLPQAYPPPAGQYSAGAGFSADHNAGGVPPLQYPTSPSSGPPGGYGGSGYPDGTCLVTLPPELHRSQPLGHQGNVANTRGAQGGSLGMPQAEQTSFQQPQPLRETGATYNTSGAPRVTVEAQSIVRPPKSFGKSLRVETSGQRSLLPNGSPSTSLQQQPGVATLFSSLKQTPQEPQGGQQPILQANQEPPPDYDDKEENGWKEPNVHKSRPAGVGGGESLPAEGLQSQEMRPGLTRGEEGGSFTTSPDRAWTQPDVTGQMGVGAPSFTSDRHHSSSMEGSDQEQQNPLPPDSLRDFSFAGDMRGEGGHVTRISVGSPSSELHLQGMDRGQHSSQEERAGALTASHPEAAGRRMGDGEEMSSSHALGDQPIENNQKSGDFWRDPPDWCYINEEGNSTAYLGPNTDLQDLNPDRASYRGMQDYGADNSFQHLSRSEFDSSSSIEILPMPSRTSDFSSFADPTSGSLNQAIPSSEPEHPAGPPSTAAVEDKTTSAMDNRQEEVAPEDRSHATGQPKESNNETPLESFVDMGEASGFSGNVGNEGERAPGNPDIPEQENRGYKSDEEAVSHNTSSSMEVVLSVKEQEREEEEARHQEDEETRRSSMEAEAPPQLWDEEEKEKQDKEEHLQEKPKETMPEGKMVPTTKPSIHLDGFGPDCGTIVIEYSFSNGIQGDQHPAPGQPYKGTFRRAFLPDNQEGQRALQLLQKAFDRKLTFHLERNADNQEWRVEFTGIPHKTSLRGGPTGSGYPDPEYLSLLRQVLESHGIK